MAPSPKPKVVKDPAYLAYVRTLPCWLCGQRSSDTMGKGLSEASHLDTKSRDDRCLPMDGSCHRTGRVAWHSGQKSFCAYWGKTKAQLIRDAEGLYREWVASKDRP